MKMNKKEWKIFWCLKLLESLIIPIVIFIPYWLGKFAESIGFLEPEIYATKFGTWMSGIFGVLFVIVIIMVPILILVFVRAGILTLIEKNKEWAKEINYKSK